MADKSKIEKTKHTPGPWHISQPIGGYAEITGSKGELIFDLAAGKLSAETCEANARLIEAAPDLLAALKEAEAIVIAWAVHYAIQGCITPQEYTKASEMSGWNPVHRGIYEKVKAAIAKAEAGERNG